MLRMKNVAVHLEYTGSSYEGVKVAKSPEDDDLEFDVMVILKGGDWLTAQPFAKMSRLRLALKPLSNYKDKFTTNVPYFSDMFFRRVSLLFWK